MKKSLQFELWHECNNFCDFCFLGAENMFTPVETKIQSLKDAIKNSEDFNGDIIAIIGGEFFQGQISNPEVHDLFYKFISLIINKLNNKEIDTIWITATLTDKKPKDLIEFLNFTKNNWNGNGSLFICTSYDVIGRFHIEQKRLNWEENMNLISSIDPRIHKNTTMILTGALIDAYLNNEISFLDFDAKYNTSLMIKHPNPGKYKTLKEISDALPGFIPERQKTLRFFKKLKLKESPIFDNCIFNVNLRADNCIKRDNNGNSYVDKRDKTSINEYSFSNSEVLPCGHSTLYKCYKDSDECMKCDYLNIRNNS